MYSRNDLLGVGRLYYLNDDGTEYDLTVASGTSLWNVGLNNLMYPIDVGEYDASVGTGLSVTYGGDILMNGSLTVEGEIIGRGTGDLVIKNTGSVIGHDLIVRTINYGDILIDSVADVKFKDKSSMTIPLSVNDTAWNSYFVNNGSEGILDALNLLASGAEGGSEWTVTGTTPGILHPLTTSRDFALGGDSTGAPLFFDTSLKSLYLGKDLYVGNEASSDNDMIYFDSGAHWIAWDDPSDSDIGISGTETRFEMNAGLGITGALETTGNAIIGGGNLQITPIISPVTCDSNAKGYVYYDSTTDNLNVCDGSVWVDLTAGAGMASYWLLNGTNLYPDDTSYDLIVGGSDSTAPFFFDTSEGKQTIGGNMSIGYALSTNDDYLYFDRESSYVKWNNSDDRFDISDELYLGSGLTHYAGLSTAPISLEGRVYYNSSDNNIYLYDGTDWRDLTAGADAEVYWQLSTGVLNPTDVAYNLAVGGSTSSAPLYFDATSTSLYMGGSLYLGRTSGSDNDYVYFDNSTSRWLAWDDGGATDIGISGRDRFELSHGLGITGALLTSGDGTIGGNLVVSGGDFRLVPKGASSFTCDSSNNGRLYYDSDVEKMYMCDGTSWVDMLAGGGSAGDYWDRDDINGFVYPSNYTDNLVLGSNSVSTARLYMEVSGAQNKMVGDDSRNLDILARGGLYLRSYDTTGSGDIYSIAGGNIKFQNSNIRAGSGGSTYIKLTNNNFTGWNTNIPSGSRAIVDAINWLAGGGAGSLWYDNGTETWLGNDTSFSTDYLGIGTIFATGAPQEKLTVAGGNLSVYDGGTYSSTEMVINGNFTTNPDTAWTWGTNWSHDTSAGNAVNTPGTITYLQQNVNVTAGQIYRIQFRVSECSVGTVTVRLGNVYGEPVCASNTLYTQVIRTTSTNNLIFYPTIDFNGKIDDVSVRLVTGGNLLVQG
ncbi:MAG TPA: hypothetical protein PLN17_05820, partial [Candidatus Cloacimonas sp.]|nr:hypothetical protein [Candidatus Cloacimonas sp.]